MKHLLIYDCEIINFIPDKRKPNNPNYSYCSGWADYNNMGISVIGSWRNFDLINILGKNFIFPIPWGKYQAFINPNSLIPGFKYGENRVKDFISFYKLALVCDRLIGFNSVAFDDKLCHANGMDAIKTDFDLLREVRIASNQPPDFVPGVTRGGYNLQNLALTNLGKGKTESGELAPVLWQDGKKQEVIDYCLNDVKLLRSLYFKFINGLLRDPHSGKLL